ncbi:MAG TPA: nitroreductase/quinone reductase family protein [Candidatus Limnocylindria bacterium]
MSPLPQVSLVTTGARSGIPRTVTLYAWEDGESLVVVGSKGGAARNPGWVHNLRAHPRASVRTGSRSSEVDAAEVPEGPERDRIWRLVAERFPLYETYQRRTSRLIPLFVLTRLD